MPLDDSTSSTRDFDRSATETPEPSSRRPSSRRARPGRMFWTGSSALSGTYRIQHDSCPDAREHA